MDITWRYKTKQITGGECGETTKFAHHEFLLLV